MIRFCAVHEIGWSMPDHEVTDECFSIDNEPAMSGVVRRGRFRDTPPENRARKMKELKKRRAKNKMRRISRNKNR